MPTLSTKTIVRREPRESLPTFDGNLHPLLRRIYENRRICGQEELDLSLSNLHPPDSLKGIKIACRLLHRVLKSKGRILVIGDYDTDGATASTVALLGLRALGVEQVDYLVPNRFDFGYGLSPEIANVALSHSPDLVITVDNGITSLEGVRCLRDKGIEVIVTDHHLSGEELPIASAIVNPNQSRCAFPSKSLAGVGVMFYLLLALRRYLNENDWFAKYEKGAPNLANHLDLVALGTVADVVHLDYNNRILVAQGIARIQRGVCRPGIKAILAAAGKDYSGISSTDLGFIVAPRLNAAGRLDDISMGIECLLTDDNGKASELAATLHEINTERKLIEQQMQRQATKFVSDIEGLNGANGICLYQEDWHQGITGLVASRIKDRLNQPVIIFAEASAGKLKGSARSISGLHIRDLIEDISRRQPGLVEKFGGHAMAAGLTLTKENFATFSDYFYSAVSEHFSTHNNANQIYTDGPLEPEFFTRQVAELLKNAAPWGQGFGPPVFDNVFKVIGQKVVGDQHLKLRLAMGNQVLDGIAFRFIQPGETAPNLDRIRAAFQLDLNEFRGTKSLQLIIEHLEPVSELHAREIHD